MISDVNFGLIVFTAKLELGDSFSLLWLYVILTLSLSTKICSDISICACWTLVLDNFRWRVR